MMPISESPGAGRNRAQQTAGSQSLLPHGGSVVVSLLGWRRGVSASGADDEQQTMTLVTGLPPLPQRPRCSPACKPWKTYRCCGNKETSASGFCVSFLAKRGQLLKHRLAAARPCQCVPGHRGPAQLPSSSPALSRAQDAAWAASLLKVAGVFPRAPRSTRLIFSAFAAAV